VKLEDSKVVVLSQNTGVQLICDSLKVECNELDESLKIPEELNEAEKELRHTKSELSKIKNTLPRLSVSFADPDEGQSYAKFQLHKYLTRTEEEIENELKSVRDKWPELHHPDPDSDLTSRNDEGTLTIDLTKVNDEEYHPIPVREYERYNADCAKYISKYAAYRAKLDEYELKRSLTISFDIQICNDGNAVAEDVDVLFHFPDGFELKTGNELGMAPTMPGVPRKPRTYKKTIHEDFLGKFKGLENLGASLRGFQPVLPNTSTFRIEKTNS
jgi:hypothetical protein